MQMGTTSGLSPNQEIYEKQVQIKHLLLTRTTR